MASDDFKVSARKLIGNLGANCSNDVKYKTRSIWEMTLMMQSTDVTLAGCLVS
jgi:hypothetical protein